MMHLPVSVGLLYLILLPRLDDLALDILKDLRGDFHEEFLVSVTKR